MSALTIHPEQHPRFLGSMLYSEIRVHLDDEDGDGSGYFVELSIETTELEHLEGPKRPPTDELERARHYLAAGDPLERQLDPAEARALAAALLHFAGEADRRRAP